MRNRKLTQEEAFEEYLIYQIRLFEFAEMFRWRTISWGELQASNFRSSAKRVRNHASNLFGRYLRKFDGHY